MPKISQIDEVPCQAEVRILQKITLKMHSCAETTLSGLTEKWKLAMVDSLHPSPLINKLKVYGF